MTNRRSSDGRWRKRGVKAAKLKRKVVATPLVIGADCGKKKAALGPMIPGAPDMRGINSKGILYERRSCRVCAEWEEACSPPGQWETPWAEKLLGSSSLRAGSKCRQGHLRCEFHPTPGDLKRVAG